ncbi:MAG: hypothetical protein OJI67_11940 [Prosthecobacter sp.]|nr:hypothetical protein [Prosthecobacter sp.]
MIALKIAHNGQPVCTAGIGDLGVISSHVTWVHSLNYRTEPDGEPTERVDLTMHIGGLHTPLNEHRTWDTPEIEVGDTITVQVVETDDISPHAETRSGDQLRDEKKERDYVRRKASEFGWTIIEESSSSS